MKTTKICKYTQVILLIISISLMLYSCKRATNTSDEIENNTNTNNIKVPTVTTKVITDFGDLNMLSGGEVTENGGAEVTSRGVVWDTNPNPTVSLTTKSSDGTGNGAFISKISNLNENAKYYIRAYATNSKGTAYGEELSITAIYKAPRLTTNAVSEVTHSTAKLGGNISSQGTSAIVKRGIVWDTNPNPTISTFYKSDEGNLAGLFASTATFMKGGTKYYARAYATNKDGYTGYGNEVSFTTIAGLRTYIANTSIRTEIKNKIWINGIPNELPQDYKILDFFVNDSNDVFILVNNNGNYNLSVLKNGIPVNFFNQQPGGSGKIYAYGNDIYVIAFGSGSTSTNLWKNGLAITLPNNGFATDIQVSGNDVYVLGTSSYSSQQSILWKNESPTVLGNYQYPSKLFVEGSDVYYFIDVPIPGGYGFSAHIFKNNQLLYNMQNKNSDTTFYSFYSNYGGFAVKGSDVYAVNSGYKTLDLFKNGNYTTIDNSSYNFQSTSITVYQNDVYVSASKLNNYNDLSKKFILYKNGVQQLITVSSDKNEFLLPRIFVKP